MKRTSIPVFLLSVFLVFGCAATQRGSPSGEDGSAEYKGVPIHEQEVTEETVGGEVYGPGPIEEGIPAPGFEGEEEAVEEAQEPKLCLVLSPGMAKAVAHASVLEVIRKANLPVHCVVGTEMGAVVAALYSQANGSTNSLQWQLFKLNKETYFNFPLLSLREPKSSGEKLNDFLRRVFGGKRIEDLPIRFATVATDASRGGIVTMDKGTLSDALSATLAIPGIFSPWEFGGRSYQSGAVASPAPLELAKSLGGNFLVLVDVVSDSGGSSDSDARFQRAYSTVRNLLRLQKRDASFVIEVKAGTVPFDDFSRQGAALAAGTKAAEKSVPELKAAWEKWVAGQ